MSKEAIKKWLLWLTLALVLVGAPIVKEAVAAPPTGWGNYTLAFYRPPTFAINIWLGEQHFATIFYDGEKFQVDTSFQGKMRGETLRVFGDAIDYALEMEKAMDRSSESKEVAQ